MALDTQVCLEKLARRIAARMAPYTTAEAQACPEYEAAVQDMGWLTALASSIGEKVVVQKVMEELLGCDPDSRVVDTPRHDPAPTAAEDEALNQLIQQILDEEAS